MDLVQDKIAIITGGASGIGRAACRAMAREGATVAVLDVNGDGAAATAAEVGGRAFPADVTDANAMEQAIGDASSWMGGLHALFNNAGASNMAKIHEWDVPEWERIVGLNLSGVFHGLRVGLPRIVESGGGAGAQAAPASTNEATVTTVANHRRGLPIDPSQALPRERKIGGPGPNLEAGHAR